MDNKRGVEGGGVIGEVTDVRNGSKEEFGVIDDVERLGESGGEKAGEVSGGVGQGMPVQPMMVSAVSHEDKAGITSNGGQSTDLVNLTTKDGEGIEKEWVRKVRSVISETKEDPRRRGDEIFEVKKDFIMKRFGRKIGGGK